MNPPSHAAQEQCTPLHESADIPRCRPPQAGAQALGHALEPPSSQHAALVAPCVRCGSCPDAHALSPDPRSEQPPLPRLLGWLRGRAGCASRSRRLRRRPRDMIPGPCSIACRSASTVCPLQVRAFSTHCMQPHRLLGPTGCACSGRAVTSPGPIRLLQQAPWSTHCALPLPILLQRMIRGAGKWRRLRKPDPVRLSQR